MSSPVAHHYHHPVEAHREWHGVGGVNWRVTDVGLEVEGVEHFPDRDRGPRLHDGLQRTPGKPATCRRIWTTYRAELAAWARWYSTAEELRLPVPPLLPLLIATAATETAGDARKVRKEPGFQSYRATPHRVSIGLCQTLISSARDALAGDGVPAWQVTHETLLVPAVSIRAAAAYLAATRDDHLLDPPRVAAAYNAGRVKVRPAPGNPWSLHCYPSGSGRHVTRFCRWWGDALEVLRMEGLPVDGRR